jgi:CRP/FNR family cyclic AMP-dependent transcriptional regulator
MEVSMTFREKKMPQVNNSALLRFRESLSEWRVPQQFTDEIIERHIAVSYAKGAMVFSEGSTADLFACVLSGYVKVYCPVGDGSRTLMRLAGPGELIGYADYIDSRGQKERLFEAQALSKCNVALVTRDHIARLLKNLNTETLIEMIESLNTFWSLNTRWFATLIGLPFWERLEIVLSELASRVGAPDNRGVMLIPEICHEDLAEMIGCSRPMISRLIGEMAEAGLISRGRKQYILLNKWETRGISDPIGRRAVADGARPTSDTPRGNLHAVATPARNSRGLSPRQSA